MRSGTSIARDAAASALKAAAPAVLCLVLGGCALAPTGVSGSAAGAGAAGSAEGGSSSGRAPGSADRGGPGGDAAADANRGSFAASRALLEQSRAELAAGSYDRAEASIERALRIAPNDATLWLELGEIKLASGDAEQAALMARKAMTLAGGDADLRTRAERLIDAAAR